MQQQREEQKDRDYGDPEFPASGTGDLVERGMSFGVASVKLIIPASISSSINGDHDAF